MMMKAAPSASFIVAEPEFLLQFLIVALDPPAQFGEIDEIPQRHIGWQTGQPILRRFGCPFGHSIKHHSSGLGLTRLSSRCAGRTRTAANRDINLVLLPSRQATRSTAVSANS